MEGLIIVGVVFFIWMMTAPMRATKSVMNEPGMKELGQQIDAAFTQAKEALTQAEEIQASVLALGRKGAETWCMTKIAAYDPDLTQTELKSAYNNLKAMDMEALGVAIVEVAEL